MHDSTYTWNTKRKRLDELLHTVIVWGTKLQDEKLSTIVEEDETFDLILDSVTSSLASFTHCLLHGKFRNTTINDWKIS